MVKEKNKTKPKPALTAEESSPGCYSGPDAFTNG